MPWVRVRDRGIGEVRRDTAGGGDCGSLFEGRVRQRPGPRAQVASACGKLLIWMFRWVDIKRDGRLKWFFEVGPRTCGILMWSIVERRRQWVGVQRLSFYLCSLVHLCCLVLFLATLVCFVLVDLYACVSTCVTSYMWRNISVALYISMYVNVYTDGWMVRSWS